MVVVSDLMIFYIAMICGGLPKQRRAKMGHVSRPLRTISIVAGLVWVGCTALAAAANARPLLTGVSGLEGYEASTLERVRIAGARFAYVPVGWGGVAPRQEPHDWNPRNPADAAYDWRATDLAVAAVVEAGLTPVIEVHGAPAWSQSCTVPSGIYGAICGPDPTQFSYFAEAASARYSGHFGDLPHVRFWQALNEPNLSLFFNPQYENGKPVSPKLYRKLLNSFYYGVKSVSPSDRILAAGLGPIEVRRWTIGPMRFARELLCMVGRRKPRPTGGKCEGGVHFDIFDIHPYTTGGPTHKGHVNDVELGDLEKLHRLLKAADQAGRIKGRFRRTPLWVTEFSWDSKPPDPGGVPMRILKRWTAEALYRAWRTGISHFFWYSLRDEERGTRSFSETVQSGLYFADKPKPNMYAFRFPFVAYSRKSGFFFWGRTPNSRGGRVLIQIRKGGGWRNAMVARANRSGIFKGVARGTYGRHKRGTVRARYRGERSVPFSLKPVKDFYQAPFGNP